MWEPSCKHEDKLGMAQEKEVRGRVQEVVKGIVSRSGLLVQ